MSGQYRLRTITLEPPQKNQNAKQVEGVRVEVSTSFVATGNCSVRGRERTVGNAIAASLSTAGHAPFSILRSRFCECICVPPVSYWQREREIVAYSWERAAERAFVCVYLCVDVYLCALLYSLRACEWRLFQRSKPLYQHFSCISFPVLPNEKKLYFFLAA